MPSDDEQLLERYRSLRCEQAFEELVERHLGLVRGAAGRIVRNHAGARDVAQHVFTKLASKPKSVPKGLPLVTWLHRTTRSLAINHVRSEERRRNREAHAAYLDEMNANDDHTEWETMAPIIDAALDALNSEDRSAILLRFYEGASHREIGQQLGVKEDTARVRVARALEKLRGQLGKRQVAVTTTMLAAGLSVGLPSSSSATQGATVISKQALASAQGSFLMSPVWWVLGLSIFGVSSSVSYWVARQSPPEEIVITSSPIEVANRSVLNAKPVTPTGLSPEQLRKPIPERLQLAVDLWNEKAYDDYGKVMESFKAAECLEALDVLDQDHTYNATLHRQMSRALVKTLALDDVEAIAEEAIQRQHRGDFYWKRGNRLFTVIDVWGSDNHERAAGWLKRQDLAHATRVQLMESLVRSASASDPQAAIALLLEVPHLSRQDSYGMFQSMEKPELREWTLASTANVVDETDRALIFARSLLPDIETPDALEEAYDRMNFTQSDAVVPLLDRMVDRTEVGSQVFQRALAFALKNSPHQAHAHFLDRYVAEWKRRSPESAEAWLGEHGLTESDLAAAVASFNTR